MERTDLQRLFARKATRAVLSLEDFTTEALCIAVGRDPRPLARALQRVEESVWADARSGRPSIDLSAVASASADTQRYLYHEGLKGGRLDLLVKLSGANGTAETLWIEVKIDAGLTWNDDKNQLEIYLEHRELEPSRPVVLTLAKTTPLVKGVAGITWADLIDTVERTPDADPWWADLVAFLRAEGAAAPPLVDEALAIEVMPVFVAVDKTIRALWLSPPRPLHWGSWLKRVVRSTYKQHGYIWMTGGPLRYGLVQVAGGWEWRVAVATGSDAYRVHVGVEEVLEGAKSGQLPDTWERLGDPGAVVQKRRRHEIGAPLGPTADWLSDALQEVEAAKVLELYFRALRASLEAEAEQRAAEARTVEMQGR